ncbi:MAG: adenylate cyclase [Halioglobus sp.]
MKTRSALFLWLSAFLLLSLIELPVVYAQSTDELIMANGNAARGRLVFGPCRSCHYAEKFMGHNNGPNLHRIFGKVAGKQEGFEYYSELFKNAEFVWTPDLLYRWLANPQEMFPGSSMMSLGVPDPQQRSDLIAFLRLASVRD